MNKLVYVIPFIFIITCCATLPVETTCIKPVYPQMDDCPDLPEATQDTFLLVTTVTVPTMYKKCKADHDMVKDWLMLEENKK